MSSELMQYVYALMDPRNEVIFCIGQGKGDRAYAHMIEASSPTAESQKVDRIREIENSGLKVRTLILAKEYERSEAFAIETALIIQARNSGEVMGIKTDLTNIARGHHEGRFRPWDSPQEIAGFEYQKSQAIYDEAFEHCQPMYDYIIENVPEFGNPTRKKGSYIRSERLTNGFEC